MTSAVVERPRSSSSLAHLRQRRGTTRPGTCVPGLASFAGFVEHTAVPTITQISEQRRKANRRNVYLDGAFAFACNLNVVAKFRLRDGLVLTDDEVVDIKQGEVRQECYDHAMRFLQR